VRNVFLALVAANIVYFAWAHWVDEPKAPPPNEALARLPRLKLLSELPAGQRPATNTKTVLNESAGCMSVGPFADITNAAKAAGILTSRGFAPRQRAEQAGTSAGFWVYVGGLKDDVEADRVRVSLERSGIKDALLMPATAETGRRVSLGLFSDRAHAEQRAAAVKRMGFKAEVAEHKLPQTVYWIDLAPRPGMTTVPIQDLFAEGVGSRIAVQPCPVVSPPAPAPASSIVTASAATAPAGAPATSGALPAQQSPAVAPKYPLPTAPAPQTAGTPKPAAGTSR
jgi:SPOR domain